MDGPFQVRSIGQLLYTQNPFYLISCGLIIYGLQVATSGGDLASQSALLALCTMGYTMLMSLTVVAVVRLAKVWQDARSILFVVMISQLACSVGFDLLCIANWQLAARLLLGGYAFAIISTEFVLRGCGLRFPFWYRLTYYVLLLVFFAFPVAGGYAVASGDLVFARWSAPFFSTLFAIGMLLLVPAIGRGAEYVRDNGTPWGWPLYPLSLFFVFVVIAGIRSHAVWMSFGSFTGGVVFEPFLLLPIALAGLVLATEFAKQMKWETLTNTVMTLAPFLFVLGWSRNGLTHLAIGPQLQLFCGSAVTLALVATLSFYVYAWIRRVRGAEHAVIITMLVISTLGTLPLVFAELGIMRWMITALAALSCFGFCWCRRESDSRWLTLAGIVAIVIVQLGQAYAVDRIAVLIASIWMLASMMTLGAVFRTDLAYALRQLSAGVMLVAGGGMITWHFLRDPFWGLTAGLATAVIISVAYAHVVRRSGWLGIAAVHLTGLSVLLMHSSGWTLASFDGAHWPLQSGIVCLGIGLVITSLKGGLHRRMAGPNYLTRILASYQRGF